MNEREPRFTPESEQEPNSVEVAQEAVMTAEQYAEIEHDIPYIFEVESGDKKITYFGAGHSWDPDDPMWIQLKGMVTGAQPNMVIVEGFENLANRKEEATEEAKKYNEEEIIGRHGESGVVLKWATELGIDFDSPEPSDREQFKFLEQQGLSKDSIFAQQFFMMIPQWQQYTDKPDFKEFAQKQIDRFEHNTNWSDFEYSYEHLEQIAEKIWGEGINLADPGYYHDRTDPIPWADKKKDQTEVNRVSEASNRFRDQYMISRIAEYLQTHDRIFIVYGASHAVMQEPALRKLLQKQQNEKIAAGSEINRTPKQVISSAEVSDNSMQEKDAEAESEAIEASLWEAAAIGSTTLAGEVLQSGAYGLVEGFISEKESQALTTFFGRPDIRDLWSTLYNEAPIETYSEYNGKMINVANLHHKNFDAERMAGLVASGNVEEARRIYFDRASAESDRNQGVEDMLIQAEKDPLAFPPALAVKVGSKYILVDGRTRLASTALVGRINDAPIKVIDLNNFL